MGRNGRKPIVEEPMFKKLKETSVKRIVDKPMNENLHVSAGITAGSKMTDANESAASGSESIETIVKRILQQSSKPMTENLHVSAGSKMTDANESAASGSESIEMIVKRIVQQSSKPMTENLHVSAGSKMTDANESAASGSESIESIVQRIVEKTVQQKISEFKKNEFVCPLPGYCPCCEHWATHTGGGRGRGGQRGQRNPRSVYRGHWQGREHSWY